MAPFASRVPQPPDPEDALRALAVKAVVQRPDLADRERSCVTVDWPQGPQTPSGALMAKLERIERSFGANAHCEKIERPSPDEAVQGPESDVPGCLDGVEALRRVSHTGALGFS